RWHWVVALLLAGLMVSCASGLRLDTPPISLQRLEAIVVKNLPNGLRERSPNGREYASNYYSPYGDIPRPEVQNVRNVAYVTILRDRRPYTQRVRVVRDQRLKGSTYEVVGDDPIATERLAESLKKALDKSRRDRNRVDDF